MATRRKVWLPLTAIPRRNMVDVLRNGFKDRGANFSIVFFEPNSGLNLEHQELYLKNRYSLIRQLKYSLKNENSIDMALFLNGIPLLTKELKNQLTGQDFRNSEMQYRRDRDPKEPLLGFKRLLAHIGVEIGRRSCRRTPCWISSKTTCTWPKRWIRYGIPTSKRWWRNRRNCSFSRVTISL